MRFLLTPSIYGPLLRFPLYAFDFRFSPLLYTIPTIFDSPLPPPYSIPSLVVSVVAIAVTEVLVYTSPPLRFYTFRFLIYNSLLSELRIPPLYLPIYDAPGLPSKTSNACITAVIAEVLAQISRTILGTLERCFKWYRTRESFLMYAPGTIQY
jgi:hypothetical protein